MRLEARVAALREETRLRGGNPHRSGLPDILEHREAVCGLRHRRKLKTALRARLCEAGLLLMQIVGFVLCMPAARTNTDQAGTLQLEIGYDVLHDGTGAHRP